MFDTLLSLSWVSSGYALLLGVLSGSLLSLSWVSFVSVVGLFCLCRGSLLAIQYSFVYCLGLLWPCETRLSLSCVSLRHVLLRCLFRVSLVDSSFVCLGLFCESGSLLCVWVSFGHVKLVCRFRVSLWDMYYSVVSFVSLSQITLFRVSLSSKNSMKTDTRNFVCLCCLNRVLRETHQGDIFIL